MSDASMNFGEALAALKAGSHVGRAGWNGRGMWLVLVQPAGNIEQLYAGVRGVPERYPHLPWIGMKTADDKFVPWLASQTDLLAEDWGELVPINNAKAA